MTLIQRWKQISLPNKLLIQTGALVAFGTLFYAGAAAVQVCLMRQAARDSAAQVERLSKATDDAIKTAVDTSGQSLDKSLAQSKASFDAVVAEERAALDASAKQSKAALDASVDSARVDQRAWMDLIIFAPQFFQADRPFSTNAQVKNLGKTPARSIMAGWDFTGIPRGRLPSFDDGTLHLVNFGMLPPQGPGILPVEITPGHPDDILGEPRFNAIRSGDLTVFYWGRINYDDMFGYHHWLQFCYIYNVPHTHFDLCGMHNAIDDENR